MRIVCSVQLLVLCFFSLHFQAVVRFVKLSLALGCVGAFGPRVGTDSIPSLAVGTVQVLLVAGGFL